MDNALSLEVLNSLEEPAAFEALMRCCGSTAWAREMVARRPFVSAETLMQEADLVWSGVDRVAILEAFSHHPRIGASLDKLREKFASTSAWSGQEQRGVAAASEETLNALRDGNIAYEQKFGHIFIVCATGKSASEMLALLNARLGNEPTEEFAIAAGEQGKITKIRLEKLLS